MSRPAEWLSLAAAPTFAAMAVMTATANGPAGMLCAPGQGGLLTGMTTMYLLMAAFHAPSWLRGAERLWR